MDKEGKTVKIALKCTCISAVRGRESKKETDAKEGEREGEGVRWPKQCGFSTTRLKNYSYGNEIRTHNRQVLCVCACVFLCVCM